jgi:hypothetical protein
MNQDFLDLLRAFIAAEVRFLIVGAYALGVHGRPRAPGVVIACEFAGGPWRCRVAVDDEIVAALCDTPRAAGEKVTVRTACGPRHVLEEDR